MMVIIPATMIVLSTMRTATYPSASPSLCVFIDGVKCYCRPDAAYRGQDFEERAERDLCVVTATKDVRRMMVENRPIEKGARDREDERADEQPPDDAGGALI